MEDLKILKQTFEHLFSFHKKELDVQSKRKKKVVDLLKNKFDADYIENQCDIIYAQYKILPNRSIKSLSDRILILFNNKLEPTEASKVLNLLVFGSEEMSLENDFMADMHKANMGFSEEAYKSENEVSGASGSFGFDKNNPIPINGIDMIPMYFQRLKLVTGETLRAERLGSVHVSHLPYPVDQYQLYLSGGEKHTVLYVYAYHPCMTSKAPVGFSLV